MEYLDNFKEIFKDLEREYGFTDFSYSARLGEVKYLRTFTMRAREIHIRQINDRYHLTMFNVLESKFPPEKNRIYSGFINPKFPGEVYRQIEYNLGQDLKIYSIKQKQAAIK